MQNLIGHTIKDIQLCESGFRLTIKTDSHKFTYETEGDCCAHAYLLKPDESDVSSVLGREVVSVVRNSFSQEHGYGQLDTEFISIQTHGGDLRLEMRTEHNGYYSGWLNFVSKEPIWPVFDDIREEAEKNFKSMEQ